jgi:hypothetical protein
MYLIYIIDQIYQLLNNLKNFKKILDKNIK